MKKTILSLLLFSIAFILSAFEIVIPDEAGKLVFPPEDTYKYPAEFLQKHIEKATGKKLPIVKESAASKDKRKIFIGNTNAAKKYNFKCNPEELILQPDGKDLIITGEITPDGTDRGTLFGVYEYLEREFGIRFLYADNPRWSKYGPGTVIPKKSEITFPTETVRSAPTFQQREGGVGYYNQKLPVQKLWHPVLRFGTTLPRQNANHTQVYWYELYSKTHPEYFKKDSNGKVRLNPRHVYRNYICLSSDAVLERMMQNIADFDAGKPEAKKAFGPRYPKNNYVYFACNDGLVTRTTCHCEKCAPMLEKNRNYEAQGTELFFRFATKYANAIKAKYPERKLAVLAYSHYLAPPKKSVIPDNMEVTYVGPAIHYASNPDIYNMHSKYIRQWSKLLKNDRSKMTLWFNIVNPQVYLSNSPFMYHHVFQKFMQEHRNEVSGAFINGLCPYLRRLGDRGFYGTIHTIPMMYLQGKMMWNIDCNVDDVLKDFCDKSYGEGGEKMLEFYNLITDRWEARYQDNESMSQFDYIHQIRYPQPVIAKMKSLLNEAAEAAKYDKESYKRIVYLRDRVYSRFFNESEEFHKTDRLRRVYECHPVQQTPVIDGDDKDIQWQNTDSLELTKFQKGEKSRRKSQIKLLYHKDKLYFLAEFFNPTDKDELRIQAARKFDPMKGMYAANINRYWQNIMELRIDKNGKATRYGKFPACEFKVSEKDGRRIIEGSFPYKSIASGMPDMPSMRLQFIRYTDIWNDYETTSPTLSGISDYPTWRLLIVDLLPETKVVGNSEESHKKDHLRRVYECYPVPQNPVVDGDDKDIQWQNTYPLELTKFQKGEKSKRKSQVKLLYHKDKFYFLAEFFNPTDKDELRIQAAGKFDPMKGIYTANNNRNMQNIMEVRIDKNGKLTSYGNFPACEVKVSEKDGRRIIEGSFPYKSIASGMPYMPSMRLQFIRYTDIWNDYETTSPTLAGISDYPTWRLLIVDLLPETKVVRDGLE